MKSTVIAISALFATMAFAADVAKTATPTTATPTTVEKKVEVKPVKSPATKEPAKTVETTAADKSSNKTAPASK